jgi:hypothetical protein
MMLERLRAAAGIRKLEPLRALAHPVAEELR